MPDESMLISVFGSILFCLAIVIVQGIIEYRAMAKLRRIKHMKDHKWVECANLGEAHLEGADLKGQLPEPMKECS